MMTALSLFFSYAFMHMKKIIYVNVKKFDEK